MYRLLTPLFLLVFASACQVENPSDGPRPHPNTTDLRSASNAGDMMDLHSSSDAGDTSLDDGILEPYETCSDSSKCPTNYPCSDFGVCAPIAQCALHCGEGLVWCENGIITIQPIGAWEGNCGEEPECDDTEEIACPGECLENELGYTEAREAANLALKGDLSDFCVP